LEALAWKNASEKYLMYDKVTERCLHYVFSRIIDEAKQCKDILHIKFVISDMQAISQFATYRLKLSQVVLLAQAKLLLQLSDTKDSLDYAQAKSLFEVVHSTLKKHYQERLDRLSQEAPKVLTFSGDRITS
jgi:hypothetical protein